MESVAHNGHAGSPNQDDHNSQPTTTARPGLDSGRTGGSPPPAEGDPAVEQLKQLLLREAARLRENRSGFMTVVVCVDEQTELLVHFSQNETGLEASARCERGDESRLHALWSQLQKALAPRKISLAPLRSCHAGRSAASQSLLPSRPEGHAERNHTPVTRPDWETWA